MQITAFRLLLFDMESRCGARISPLRPAEPALPAPACRGSLPKGTAEAKQTAEKFCFVSGHDFRRASIIHGDGLKPCES